MKKERLRGAKAVLPFHRIEYTFYSSIHFAHTASIKFLHGSLLNHALLQPDFEFLLYVALLEVKLKSKILVLFGWELGAGNSNREGKRYFQPVVCTLKNSVFKRAKLEKPIR